MNHNPDKPKLDVRTARLKLLAAQIRLLCDQDRLDEAEALVCGREWVARPNFKDNARCRYIHGRGWVER
jgi:hypothetical protein